MSELFTGSLPVSPEKERDTKRQKSLQKGQTSSTNQIKS
jgi:hypothetical protein